MGSRRWTVPVAMELVHFGQRLRKVFGVFSEVAQLALLAHTGDGVGRELDLVGVPPVRIRPHVHVVCRTIRQLTGGTRAEHRCSDRLAARVDLERPGGARYIIDGAGYNRARIPSFLPEQKPVPGRVVLEARDTQAPTRRDDTPHPLARKPPCERNAHCDETSASAVHARVEPTHPTTNMLLEVADLNPAAQDREPQGRCVCGEKVTIADAHEITLPNGRPGWEGYCPICRAPLFAIRRGSRASS